MTYSSCLALLYFSADPRQLSLSDIMAVPRRWSLYQGLLGHPGIGLIATRTPDGVHIESRSGTAIISNGDVKICAGDNPLEPFGTQGYVTSAIESLVNQPNAGDFVLFGAYDGYDIISFDDQVGAHGSAGGDQVYPFLISPSWLNAGAAKIENARDINRVILRRYT